MKLDRLLLKRAAALGDKSTILQIFFHHFPEISYQGTRFWSIGEDRFIPFDCIMLKTPIGSFRYSEGAFRTGIWIGSYCISYGRGFCRDAIL